MPELPEVEVTRLSFVDRIAGAEILKVRVGKPLRWPLGCAPDALAGRKVLQVRRRGKYLLLDMSQGMLLVHLGMSGSILFESVVQAAGTHDHFDLVTSRGTLRLHDPRRFGAVVYVESEMSTVSQKLLGKLGVEPLGDNFDATDFAKSLKLRKASIKQVLLSGQVVVGVGNIYASEALFESGIRPTVRSNRLSAKRALNLHAAVRNVLTLAVEKGGSTLRDFSNAKGQSGYFQLEVKVYGKQGEPCKTCGSLIQAIRQGQRSSFFCPVCQRS